MSDSKKRRMSMLDSLASAGAPTPPPMMSSNRALRSARDAVDSHHVWELDPALIDDHRVRDRLDHSDIVDLRDAIEANGQTVPILVRRDPADSDRYLLVYGRRRLEAIRRSDKVHKVRALVANLDDSAAVTAQVSENMARQDLSFIEKALFARELVDSGFGNQSQVADVLTVTRSSVSMALAIVEGVGEDLIRAIGPARGIGRPRWEALAKGIEASGADRASLAEIAYKAHDAAVVAVFDEAARVDADPSTAAFEAVAKAAIPPPAPANKKPAPRKAASQPLTLGGRRAGSIKRTSRGLALDIADRDFADWLESEAPRLIQELHARWTGAAED